MSTAIDAAVIKTLTNHIDNGDHQYLTAMQPMYITDNQVILNYDVEQFEINPLGMLTMKPSSTSIYTYFKTWTELLIIPSSDAYGGCYINKAVNMKHGDILRLKCKYDMKLHSYMITDSDNVSMGQFKAILLDECSDNHTPDWFYIEKKDEYSHYEPLESGFIDTFTLPTTLQESTGGYYTISSSQLLTDLTYLIKFLTKNN